MSQSKDLPLHLLPSHVILQHIIPYLGIFSLRNLMGVNKKLCQITKNEKIWLPKIDKYFPEYSIDINPNEFIYRFYNFNKSSFSKAGSYDQIVSASASEAFWFLYNDCLYTAINSTLPYITNQKYFTQAKKLLINIIEKNYNEVIAVIDPHIWLLTLLSSPIKKITNPSLFVLRELLQWNNKAVLAHLFAIIFNIYTQKKIINPLNFWPVVSEIFNLEKSSYKDFPVNLTIMDWGIILQQAELLRSLTSLHKTFHGSILLGWSHRHNFPSIVESLFTLVSTRAHSLLSGDSQNNSLLALALYTRNPSLIEQFLSEDFTAKPPKGAFGRLPLQMLATYGSTPHICSQIVAKAKIATTDEFRYIDFGSNINKTSLYLAIEHNHEELALSLIEAGADLGNVQDGPILLTITKNSANLFKVLFNNITETNPLELPVFLFLLKKSLQNRATEIINYLIEFGERNFKINCNNVAVINACHNPPETLEDIINLEIKPNLPTPYHDAYNDVNEPDLLLTPFQWCLLKLQELIQTDFKNNRKKEEQSLRVLCDILILLFRKGGDPRIKIGGKALHAFIFDPAKMSPYFDSRQIILLSNLLHFFQALAEGLSHLANKEIKLSHAAFIRAKDFSSEMFAAFIGNIYRNTYCLDAHERFLIFDMPLALENQCLKESELMEITLWKKYYLESIISKKFEIPLNDEDQSVKKLGLTEDKAFDLPTCKRKRDELTASLISRFHAGCVFFYNGREAQRLEEPREESVFRATVS